MASVPNNDHFSQSDVKTVIGSYNKLTDLFSNADDNRFDPLYKGNKDRLSNFRNYDESYKWYQRLINPIDFLESTFSGYMRTNANEDWESAINATNADEYYWANAAAADAGYGTYTNYMLCGADLVTGVTRDCYRGFLRFTQLNGISVASSIDSAQLRLPVAHYYRSGIYGDNSDLFFWYPPNGIPDHLDFQVHLGTPGSTWNGEDWDEFNDGHGFFSTSPTGVEFEVRTINQDSYTITVYYLVKEASAGQRAALEYYITTNPGYVDMVMRSYHYDINSNAPVIWEDTNYWVFYNNYNFHGYVISPELWIKYH